jgi:hypothetical protein
MANSDKLPEGVMHDHVMRDIVLCSLALNETLPKVSSLWHFFVVMDEQYNLGQAVPFPSIVGAIGLVNKVTFAIFGFCSRLEMIDFLQQCS